MILILTSFQLRLGECALSKPEVLTNNPNEPRLA